MGMILTTLILGGIAISYASVPLYQRFCQVTGYGGTTRRVEESNMSSPDRWKKRPERPLTVKFYSNTNSNIPWVFYPLQNEVKLVPGESTLAFYRAENPSPDDIVGIASYNVVPAKAGIYFQKIQCFCFEEQLLPAKKGVDMPVYFVIDPDFVDDPNMHDVESISLFYTFFRAKDFDDLNAQAYDESQQQKEQQTPHQLAQLQAVVEKKEETQT
ncbi:COX11, putative [Acanthamoeba castellanii str. Neff]|uniref:COX11, putative n=1 Tax=Acanthamoeba castellanii (strain ATCC 30010 / Neff) TaxID=1257118 RepID=L8GML1_ACACF|nr:COX11, putative [Acanthamoeba castellanii str. Neff]ELR13456.1 COX11, putative [Acanthamoeba castellanii str. Neff]